MKRKVRIIVKLLIILILLLFILFIFLNQKSFAKYFQSFCQKCLVQVSNPIFLIETDDTKQIDNSNLSDTYDFCVKNYDGENVSDVSFKYKIEIVSELGENVRI